MTGLLGCDVPESNTALIPEGAPAILQVFVTESDPATGATGLGLYLNDNVEKLTPEILLENGDDGVVTNAVVDGTQTMRIVLDELIDGTTVEEFFCACNNCPNGITASLDPSMCDNDPDTMVNELGQWLDDNADGVPDRAQLLADIVTVSCAGTEVYSSGPADGFYNPSGNQEVPAPFPGTATGTNLRGLGPALVITASTGLRTNADCSVDVADSVVDKDGTPSPAPAAGTFHTAAFVLETSVPANNATGVARSELDAMMMAIPPTFTITFNAFVGDPTAVTLTKGGVAVTHTAMKGADGSSIDITPAAILDATSVYELNVPVTLLDAHDGPFPTATTITFTTGM